MKRATMYIRVRTKLPGMGWRTVGLALAAYSCLLDHRHSGPIHFDIENRNWLAEENEKIQLDRFLDPLRSR